MMSLTSFIEDWCGLKEWIFEDMREEVLALLKDISDTIHLGPQADATSLVLERFNDSDRSGPIIYYFRLLASAWLRSRAGEYQGFIPDGMGVEEYCKDVLEPSNSEIEHLGMTFLIDVLLKPVGFAVEIVYLDRSEGNQVNTHLIQDMDDAGNPTNPDGPLIYLLYRPGHYDILYKEVNLALRQQQILDAANASIQINRAAVRSQTMIDRGTSGMDFSSFDMSSFTAIPGISMSGMGSHHGFPAFTSFSDYDPVPAPTYIDTTVASTPAAISPISSVPSIASSTPAFPATALPIHTSQATHSSHPALTSHHLALSTSDLGMSSSLGSTLTSSVVAPSPGSQFRHSKYEYENDWHDSSAQTFQTSTFKNSHYNTAHYNNPNFQPEEWCPEDEEKGSGHGSGHGSGKRELRQRSM
jgi:ubiquitin thioesterase protein OTUB1